jgi:peptidoglycan hydrolase-like protein with peptidoglycan-binding domain
MGRSARLPDLEGEPQSPLSEAVAALGGILVRNPALVGGTTAFVVALSYVSANAIWYQPHFHNGAFFATRETNYVGPPDPSGETTIRIERQSAAEPPKPKPDPTIEKVQAILKSMNLYDGAVDGLNGPATRNAIAAYRKTLGMEASGDIDQSLLELLAVDDTTAGIKPKPSGSPPMQILPDSQVPVPSDPMPTPETISAKVEMPAATGPDPMIMKIQAGLKAFGNDKMEIDGVMGAKTKAAIREFQSLFGLQVTGEPGREVYAKMREIGLTN